MNLDFCSAERYLVSNRRTSYLWWPCARIQCTAQGCTCSTQSTAEMMSVLAPGTRTVCSDCIRQSGIRRCCWLLTLLQPPQPDRMNILAKVHMMIRGASLRPGRYQIHSSNMSQEREYWCSIFFPRLDILSEPRTLKVGDDHCQCTESRDMLCRFQKSR